MKVRIRALLVLGFFLLVIMSFAVRNSAEVTGSVVSSNSPTVKGLCFVAGDSIADHNMDQVLDVGANWISQTPFGWMSGHDSPEVVLNNERAWWGETDRGLIHTVEHAKESGVKTLLKPHIWLRRSNDKWRSDIEMSSEEDWQKWFESYKNWIVHYARLAQENEIEALCMGTELYQTTKQHPDKWIDIINEIRAVYDGELTYAANWYKEFESISFWDHLDYIGIQAYFPLSNHNNPTKSDILRSWDKHKRVLRKVAQKFDKKIVFTEIGYKNTADSAKEPWTWPQDMDHSVEVSNEMQLKCYHAMFESLWNEPWFDGMFIWKWFHTTHAFENYDEYFEARFERRKEWAKRRGRDLGPQVYFTPQRTEAIEVLREWYGQ